MKLSSPPLKEIGGSLQHASIWSCKENGFAQFTPIQTTRPKQRNLFIGKRYVLPSHKMEFGFPLPPISYILTPTWGF